MLRFVLFDMNLFDGDDPQERENSQFRILWLLQALTKCNELYLEQHPDTPLIYQSGIKYLVPEQFERAELPEIDAVRKFLGSKNASASVLAAFKSMADQLGAGEHFREIPRIIEHGGGDCDNVACWRAAELRVRGIKAQPYITWRKRADGGTTYHVIVRYPDGTSEDPSLLLGMGGEARAAHKQQEVEKLSERSADYIRGLYTGKPATTVFGLAQGTTPSDFGKGLQYTQGFQSGDDAYADWTPTRPSFEFYDARYNGGLLQNTPFFNTRIRDTDEDYDWEDRFNGDGIQMNKVARRVRRHLKRIA